MNTPSRHALASPFSLAFAFTCGAVSSAGLWLALHAWRECRRSRRHTTTSTRGVTDSEFHSNHDDDDNNNNNSDKDHATMPHLVTAIPGPQSQALIDILSQHECPAITARRARRADQLGAAATDPIVWASARNCLVTDVDGNVLHDWTSGFGVATLGHAHPAVVEAARHMLAQPLVHAMGDAFADATRVALLRELATLLPPLSKAILGCSGSDAIQAALKTAVLHTGRSRVLSFTGAYHGLAHGSLAPTAYHATDFREPFAQQLGQHVMFAEYGSFDLPSLREHEIGAVLVEPVQGRGGVRAASANWLRFLRSKCNEEGALLIYDEIYSGMGRTGEWFAFQGAVDSDDEGKDRSATERDDSLSSAPLPDLLCLGKALGGGFPISVCLGTKHVMDSWGASQGESLHTQTFLGNPMGCAMALAAVRELRRLDAPAVAKRKEKLIRSSLRESGLLHTGKEIRGRGLMLALTVPDPLRAMSGLLRRGIIALPCGEGKDFALALIPPLTVSEKQIRYAIKQIAEICHQA